MTDANSLSTVRHAMFSRSFPILLAACSICAPPAASATDESLRVAPIEGVLLLQNGNVISGKITRAGDRYYVALSNGELRVRATDVDVQCCDLEELYVLQRARAGDDIEAHLDLAEWCFQNGLPGQCARELADVTRREPRHPRLAPIERRLRFARRPLELATEPPATTAPLATDAELDELLTSLPSGAIGTFTGTVQPLLINRCCTAGCHAPRPADPLPLFRSSAGRPLGRRLTLQNLHSTLAHVDREQPAASRLLRAAAAPHGTLDHAVFDARSADQFAQLADWVRQVSGGASVRPPSLTGGHDPLLQTAGPDQSPTAAVGNRSAVDEVSAPLPIPLAMPAAQRVGNTAAVDADAAAPLGNTGARSRTDAFVPVDPFDPRIFNRRFRADATHGPP